MHKNVILAIVDSHPRNIVVLRAAAKKAKLLEKSWYAITVTTPLSSTQRTHEDQSRIAQNLTIAEQMGAQVISLEAEDAATGIRHFCERRSPLLSALEFTCTVAAHIT